MDQRSENLKTSAAEEVRQGQKGGGQFVCEIPLKEVQIDLCEGAVWLSNPPSPELACPKHTKSLDTEHGATHSKQHKMYKLEQDPGM